MTDKELLDRFGLSREKISAIEGFMSDGAFFALAKEKNITTDDWVAYSKYQEGKK